MRKQAWIWPALKYGFLTLPLITMLLNKAKGYQPGVSSRAQQPSFGPQSDWLGNMPEWQSALPSYEPENPIWESFKGLQRQRETSYPWGK